MNKYVSILILLLFLSCSYQNEIHKDFNCKITRYKNLEKLQDLKNKFSVELPKSWKTNFFFDTLQSSIYTADTTKQLTETFLLDITIINQSIKFDRIFKLKQQQESIAKNLTNIASGETILINKPAYYSFSKGIKGSYSYQVCHYFINTNAQNFIHVKAEVYGDSLVNNRLCEAFTLLEKIKLIK